MPIIYCQIKNNSMVSDFKKHLLIHFEQNESKETPCPQIEHFLDFLLSHQLIECKNIKRFTILKEFDIQYPLHGYHKTKTVFTLANKYGLSERSVWTVLKDHVRRFEEKNS